jgi:adenosylhomocysteine nucleosidase
MVGAETQMKILILAALPQEHSPLKKFLPGRRLVKRKPLKEFAFKLPDKEIVLIETGMGAKWAEEALRVKMPEFRPDLLIFAGFAGGLHPDMKIGDVCAIVRVRQKSCEDTFNFRFPAGLDDFLTANQNVRVTGISCEFSENKKAVCVVAAGQMAAMDMETAKVAEIASKMKIPFVCFRAISDCVDHELGFDLSDICDGRGRVKLYGVLSTVLRRPLVLRAFYLSWRRSRVAAKNLCRSVAAFVRIPADELIEMARGITIER